jgi:SAM-dependent methyltransferase
MNQWNENIYAKGLHDNHWPFHQVIASAKRFHKELGSPSEFRILELGCGVGNNSIALAAEGFQVTGIDFSDVAIAKAEARSSEKGTDAIFLVSSIEELIIHSEYYDYIFDRGAFVCLSNVQIEKSLKSIYASLKLGGKFVGFDWYGDNQPDIAWGTQTEDGTYDNFSQGRFVNQGSINFVNLEQIQEFFKQYKGRLSVIKNLELDGDERLISETFSIDFHKTE